jgi:RNA binding exosome subunit
MALISCGAKVVSKPSKLPIGYIEIRIFVHATEETEKVLSAVHRILPEEIGEELVFKSTSLSGHHGNSIILLTAKLENRQLLPSALQYIGSKLTSLDKETLNKDLKLHLEKGNLFLRFNKQQAFLGKIRFSANDPIHVKVHFKNRTTEEIFRMCKEFGLIL